MVITQSQSPDVVKFNMFYIRVEKISPRAGFELGPLDQLARA